MVHVLVIRALRLLLVFSDIIKAGISSSHGIIDKRTQLRYFGKRDRKKVDHRNDEGSKRWKKKCEKRLWKSNINFYISFILVAISFI